jgi:hypothetical protein
VGLQAVAASALAALTLRVTLGRLRLAHFALVIGVLTLATSLPFFVAFLMPDIWLGLGALSALLLLVWFDRLRTIERWAVGAVLIAALTFHATNPPDILVLALVAASGLALRVLPARPVWLALAVVGAGLMLSAIVGAAYPWAVERVTHHELARPPFLAARVLADGPGRVFLRRACRTSSPYVLCRFADRPLTDANDILWATSRARGVFEPADYATRLALVHQEGRFVTDVLAAAPLESAERLAMDSLYELTDVSVVDTLGYTDHNLVARGPRLAPLFGAVRFCVRRPLYCRSTPAQLVSEDILRWTLIGSGLYLVLRLALGLTRVRAWYHRAPLSARLTVAILGVACLLVANAILCGSLSGVYPRYQMRITWLLPLFALLAWLEGAPAPAVAGAARCEPQAGSADLAAAPAAVTGAQAADSARTPEPA